MFAVGIGEKKETKITFEVEDRNISLNAVKTLNFISSLNFLFEDKNIIR